MKRILVAAAIVGSFVAPAFAQDAASTACADYAAMDNAGQMAMIAEIESLASETSASQEMSSDMIHESLVQNCTDHPDMLVIDVVKEFVIK